MKFHQLSEQSRMYLYPFHYYWTHIHFIHQKMNGGRQLDFYSRWHKKQQGHTWSQAVLFRGNSKFIISLLDCRIYFFFIYFPGPFCLLFMEEIHLNWETDLLSCAGLAPPPFSSQFCVYCCLSWFQISMAVCLHTNFFWQRWRTHSSFFKNFRVCFLPWPVPRVTSLLQPLKIFVIVCSPIFIICKHCEMAARHVP